MAISGEQLKGIMIGTTGAKDSTEKAFAAGLAQGLSVVTGYVGDNNTPATVWPLTPLIPYCYSSIKVESIYFAPGQAVTGNDTNNKVVTVVKLTAGGSTTVVGTLTTNVATGNFLAFQPKALTLSTVAGALNLAAGDTLAIGAATIGGTGVACSPATSASGALCSIMVQYSRGT